MMFIFNKKLYHMRLILIALLLVSSSASLVFAQTEPSAESKPSLPRFLSAKEIEGLKTGDPMGMDKMAEVNGFPSPRYVLQYSADLNLTDEQAAKIIYLRKKLAIKLRQIGSDILAKEYELEQLFAHNEKIEREDLVRLAMEIAVLRGKLRIEHLYASTEIRNILTNEQIAVYNGIRGVNIMQEKNR